MATIAFLAGSESPAFSLNLWRRMTPGCSGTWGNLTGTADVRSADYVMALDSLSYSCSSKEMRENIKPEKLILMGGHPEGHRYYVDMDKENCAYRIDAGKTQAFGEWWLKYDYDYLSALQPMQKTAKLGTIVSNAETQPSHIKRKEWLARYCQKHTNKLDIYGKISPTDVMRPNYKGVLGPLSATDWMSGKEDAYAQYECMVEFDYSGKHYFSERVFDCLLMYCFMFYWGGGGVEKYLPEECNFLFDIEGEGDDILAAIASPDFYAKKLPAIKEARDLLLNKYQLWPRIHTEIYGTTLP